MGPVNCSGTLQRAGDAARILQITTLHTRGSGDLGIGASIDRPVQTVARKRVLPMGGLPRRSGTCTAATGAAESRLPANAS